MTGCATDANDLNVLERSLGKMMKFWSLCALFEIPVLFNVRYAVQRCPIILWFRILLENVLQINQHPLHICSANPA